MYGNSTGIVNDGSSIPSVFYSLIQSYPANATNHNIAGTTDPLFVNPSGGNYQLQAISPCINKGSNDSIPAGVTMDLAGNDRIYSDTVDIGAYEYVVSPPEVSLGNDTAICTGSTLTLDAGNPGATYLWSTGATTQTISVSAVGTYRVTVTNTVGTTSDTIHVSVVPLPVVDLGGDTAICSGSSLTLDADNTGSTYDWSTGAVTQTVSVNASGTYSVTVTNVNGCVATGSKKVTVNPITVPTIDIAATDTTVCTGTSVTFTATPTNGGTSPAYQWKKNGGNVGTGNSTYTYIPLNGDIITCTLTSNATCAGPASVTSSGITMVVNPTAAPVVDLGQDTIICSGNSLTLDAGNAGSTYDWSTGASTQTINVNTSGTYSVTVTNTNGCTAAGSKKITVNPLVTPAISVTADNPVCSGTSVTFTAKPTNGGATPAYQWKKNGGNVGTSVSTYTYMPANGDIITCTLTSDAACANPASVTSSGITMTVNPKITPAISITASQNDICSGTSVIFTAKATNGGASPAYQWKKNGGNVGTGASTYTYAPANGDVITCTLTSDASCADPESVTSSGITMKVNPTVTPAVSVTASQNNICSGTSVTFTAQPANGGTTPDYQWKKNGGAIGTNASTYTYAPANGDVITCTLTSDAACASSEKVTSSDVTMTVNPNVTPAVSVTASQNNICSGTSVTFTAKPANGGASPAYQWKKNGGNVGTNASAYTYAPANGDVITCTLTSNAACASPATATASGITMIVTPAVTPAVSITASQNDICSGTSVTFTAKATNGGASPAYQWKKNGGNVGTSTATYTYTPANGEVITCTLTSDAACASPENVTSSGITMNVNPNVTPTIDIAVSQNNICSGASVTFTATLTNGGASPVYQWKKSGVNVGTNVSTYTYAPSNGDMITCTLTSDAACVNPVSVTSSGITMAVTSSQKPTVSITANPGTNVATGTNVTFTAAATHEGDNPQYEWRKNGQPVAGASNATWVVVAGTDFVSEDVIKVRLLSDEQCAAPDTAISNALTMHINNGTGVDDQKGQDAIVTLYPNPNDGKFILEGTVKQSGNYEITITNVLGQRVYKQTLKAANGNLHTEISAAHLPQGTYCLLLIKDDQPILTKKFIKAK